MMVIKSRNKWGENTLRSERKKDIWRQLQLTIFRNMIKLQVYNALYKMIIFYFMAGFYYTEYEESLRIVVDNIIKSCVIRLNLWWILSNITKDCPNLYWENFLLGR
jgi:hypothetical protein